MPSQETVGRTVTSCRFSVVEEEKLFVLLKMKSFQVLFLGSVFEGPVGLSVLQATQVAGKACT